METRSLAKNNTKFYGLSSLVLVDIVSALPMEHVVIMACLGHERLRHTCSLKWVKDRMTDVTFEEVLRAYQLRGDTAATFCASSVMKRLYGEVKLQRVDLDNTDHNDDYVELAKQVPGRLHLRSMGVRYLSSKPIDECKKFDSALGALPTLIYASRTIKRGTYPLSVTRKCPGMVFDYRYRPDEGYHTVFYRPALLNAATSWTS